ncbi:MAG: GntR family transcriptional regulator [Nocardia sp.]|nr:GntR family transcriptional regulator [Nocardia sp.]NUS95413.1 GntR family transcriptional regulator [Nocardia sp.]
MPESRGSSDSPYRQLRSRIVGGTYPPGTLLVPANVGTDLGVSRTPVREALMRLEVEGLMTKESRGFVVRIRTPEEILDICEARIALEATVARSAAARRTEFDLAKLRHLLESTRGLSGQERLDRHAEWHVALRHAAHNTTALELMALLDARLRVYDGAVSRTRDNLDLIEEEHTQIFEAIRDRDPERAAKTMETHQSRTRDLRLAEMTHRR